MARNKSPLYLISVLLFMLVLPVASIAIECFRHTIPLDWQIIGKWFVFWSIGIRLFIAGLKQVTNPAFTANEIFHIRGEEAYIIIRELGFGNLSIGLIGILSLFNLGWCHLAAIAGGLYFGLAGIQHILRKPDSRNETIALVSDIYISVIMILYLVFTL